MDRASPSLDDGPMIPELHTYYTGILGWPDDDGLT